MAKHKTANYYPKGGSVFGNKFKKKIKRLGI